MHSTIRKAVFPVAGMGTRFLPATKAMPKELLPIIDKPLIQYAVEEAIEAGITQLVFVTGRTKRAIEDHFDTNPALERELRDTGKDAIADMVHAIVPDHVSCIYIRQPEALGLGHAVLCAEPAIGHEPFAVLLADDVIRASVKPTAALVAAYAKQAGTYLSVMDVARSEVSGYGMIVPGATLGSVGGLVEKPLASETPSLRASIGRYVLEPDIFDLLRDQRPGAGGEIQLADAIDSQARQGRVFAELLNGQRYDCGSKFGYLKAIVDFALAHEDYGSDFRRFVLDRTQQQAAE
ncbi:UTP--glucose-1-phosphate uridylyltransferase [Pseudorhodobacter ferrugineus]|uniref:UTP--glucose-1-phosphate uridylyltransferase n=1 Tax=Pseudorhodobacter ferrugineus TaxID=77008 RepID=UPI0004003CB2|nr:UTP--glucose-1-phosphate uridylyltransferase [Pseudorhodobacter ferrugineus]